MKTRCSCEMILCANKQCFSLKNLWLVIFFGVVNTSPVFCQVYISLGTSVHGSDSGQLTIDSSLVNEGEVVFGNQFVLSLHGEGELATIEALNVPILVMNGLNYEATGNINVQDSLLMKNGTITPMASARLLIQNEGTVKSFNQSHVDGTLHAVGEGEKFFPLGSNGVYAPVILNDIVGDTFTEIGITAKNFDLGVADELANVISSSDWHWEIDVVGNFEGSTVSLPILTEDEAMLEDNEGFPVILHSDGPGLGIENLMSDYEEGDVTVTSLLSVNKSYVLLGNSLEVDPVIHNIITADDDLDNPFLIIDNINALSGNEVTLIDRWGNVVFQKMDFKNYNNTDNLYQGQFDELSSGNYVCIVKYRDKSFNQMVTVIKE